jgi:hypothetical protein
VRLAWARRRCGARLMFTSNAVWRGLASSLVV